MLPSNDPIWNELLPMYLEGKLDAQAQQQLDAWLQSDPEHQALFEKTVLLWHQSKEVNSRLSAEQSLQHLKHKVREQKPTTPLMQPVWQRVLGIAASVIVLVGLGYWFYNQQQHVPMITSVVIQDSLRLEDGSMIYSDGSAMIDYPEHFATSSRELNQQQGMAFFEVTKNPERPFIIHHSIASIKVVGTSFRTRMNADSAEVIVTTGKVMVYNESNQIALLPGEKVVFYKNKKEGHKSTNEDTNYLYWRNGILEYDNKTLKEVFQDIEQKFDCEIHLPEALAAYKVNGRYFASNVSQLLQTLCETFNLHYTTSGRVVTILPKE